MPSSTILHLAAFATGCIAGAGAVWTVTRTKHTRVDVARPSDTYPQPKIAILPKPSTDVVINPPTDVLKYGHPGPISDILQRTAYAARYDRKLRHPAWTAEHLTLASLGKGPTRLGDDSGRGDRGNSQFKEDESLPEMFRAKLSDYFRSGYDRGHMVPAADAKISQAAMDETFLLSNIAPQVGAGFNRHYWAYLEDWCRRLTSSFSDVFVFTVPLYLPHQDPDGKWRVSYEVIGTPANVAVPTHFAKVVLASRPLSPVTPNILELSLGAFVLPNAPIPDNVPLESFSVPVETVERAAGLTLFSTEVKKESKHICRTAKCEVIVRRFDDAQKTVQGGGGKPLRIGPPQGK
ncbi:mitochondrial nuclease [Dacryopinax primogenitus]|uniref:Endonuclease n=1 Tax=Dacryopinax primogenitus (strain DJM 731) TaxID=1858805 RepID=M5FRW8_DACPD|nr:mitochondrial nuclease [Dacryopinax primogenitus]EJT98508.1 mitochondrial nuclease [Dacryopinax primogenitus]